MTDRDALYAAVLAAPDDDTPRLVFADYLDDTGVRADAIRARFIRNQVALARAEPWSDEHETLYRATAPVEQQYKADWATPNLENPKSATFSRGFVGWVACGSQWFVDHGSRMLDSHPIDNVMFNDLFDEASRPAVERLLACAPFERLRVTDFGGELVDDTFVAALAASRAARSLRRLGFDFTRLTPGGVTALLGGRLPELTGFDLSFHYDELAGRDDEMIETLVRAPGAAGLDRLRLGRVRSAPVVARALAGSPLLRGLTDLALDGTDDGVEGWAALDRGGVVALAESTTLRGLTSLSLDFFGLDEPAAVAFAEVYAWPGLKRLSLRGNAIPGRAVAAFAANPQLRSLAELDLLSNRLTVEDFDSLRQALPGTRILADGMEWRPPPTLAPEDAP
ncbi:TIGR02996 domain-containing protein [Urbifossiella limnaea]|uniref:TIGR02996 domain-containing protein n=1 Tax=Urbifossiella limnaea TaxID=2528023 RepID=A0A517XYJ0_9BACT|nr:TIGR02996 domain-containing protein [Urbifossiella limnaea]QDU22584.1 hypothetical protein ETAA1_45670 [Urbifossiella limnaea]